MSILKKNLITIFLFLMTLSLITIFYESISEKIYYNYFFYFKKSRIEKIVSTNIPDLNKNLASLPELDFVVDENESIHCVHEVVGDNNYSVAGGTIYLRVLCKKYNHNKSHFSDDQLLPFSVTQHKNTINYKTVSLTSFDKDIEEVFPFYIKPFLYSKSVSGMHPITQKLYEKFTKTHPKGSIEN